jgi:hypothetical protein
VRAGQASGLDTQELLPLDVYLLDLDDADIRREWRRIDVLIQIRHAKLVVAVELKIGSQQGPTQLVGYRRTVEEAFAEPGWRHLFVFLTVRSENPLDHAWIPLRYEALVPALEQTKAPEADPAATAALASFCTMLRRNHVTDDALEEIARKLWANHRAALLYLADRRPDGMRGVFASLREQVGEMAKQFGDQNFTFVADQSTPSILRFACLQWDTLPGMNAATKWTSSGRILLFELKRYGEQAKGEIYLGPGPLSARSPFATALAPFRRKQNLPSDNGWMCVASRVVLSQQPSEDIDVGQAKEQITAAFGSFCREMAASLDPVLQLSKVSPNSA